MGIRYNGVTLGYAPVSRTPSQAPPYFWNSTAEAGDDLQMNTAYEFNGQLYYADLGEATYFQDYEDLGIDGVWYGGMFVDMYHPTSAEGDYVFVFRATFQARLVPDIAGFRVAADPDTLGLGEEAIVGIEPIDADSAVLRLPTGTELALGLDGAAGAGFGVLRLASETDPDAVEQEGEELEAITLEAVCAERVTFTAEEYTPDGPPVVAATSGGDAARSGDLDPDIALITASLAPSNWGPGGEGEGEVLLQLQTLRLLSQNDEPYPTEGSGAALMVSRFPTDVLLPATVEFASPDAARVACSDPFQIPNPFGQGGACIPAATPPSSRPTDNETTTCSRSGPRWSGCRTRPSSRSG